jgi:hypothetical protein
MVIKDIKIFNWGFWYENIPSVNPASAAEETGAMGGEIESHQGIGW